jgi:hypothetical protein
MTQPKHALPQRRPQTPDDGIGRAPRVGVRGHDDTNLHQRADEDTSSHQDALNQDAVDQDAPDQDALHQDALHQDAWVTNFIGRLSGLVRHIGGKK